MSGGPPGDDGDRDGMHAAAQRLARLRIGFIVVMGALVTLSAATAVIVARQPTHNLLSWFAVIAAVLAMIMLVSLRGLVRELTDSNKRLREESEQRNAVQLKMLASRQRMQLLLDHMPDGVMAFDANGRIEWINPAARLIFQRAADDSVGKPVTRLVPGLDTTKIDDTPTTPDGMVAAQTPRQRLIGRRGDGSEFPIEVALVTLRSGDKRSGMIVTRDLTESERMERMKHEFVSMVSHELRTPLTSLRGALSLLADGSIEGMPPDARQLLRMASMNSERLVMLVNDILDFEKLRAGALRMHFEQVDLCDLVPKAVESVEGLAQQAQVRQKVLTRAASLPVRVDPARLTQVLTNLLSNAIKHSPMNGTVLVIMEPTRERVRVTVRDQGLGVPPDFVPKLFMPFEQASDPKHRKLGGTGLGLAISRGLMEAMHGGIGLDPPRTGDGASFWIELPLDLAKPSTFGDLVE